MYEELEELNKFVGDCLSLTKYYDWEISSYKVGSLFQSDKEGSIHGETVQEAVKRALKIVKEEKKESEKSIKS